MLLITIVAKVVPKVLPAFEYLKLTVTVCVVKGVEQDRIPSNTITLCANGNPVYCVPVGALSEVLVPGNNQYVPGAMVLAPEDFPERTK